MEVVLVIYGISMCIAFCLGASLYMKPEEKKKIENPIKMIKQEIENKELTKEMKKEQEIYKTIAENIDNYDGTSRGQKTIPR